MAISDYTEEYAGKPVADWKPESFDAQNTLPRIGLSYDDYDSKKTWVEAFAAFLDHPDAAQATGLVVGAWDYESSNDRIDPVIQAIVDAKDKLPRLTALFLGDITYEESEISWINQSDFTPLLEAYPQLEHFTVRGGEGLKLRPIRHDSLQGFTIQSGGLDAEIVRAVCGCEFPALQHLELWLGTEEYGGNVRIEDLQPILSGQTFPHLRYLGLRDSDTADEVAQSLANAPILQTIRVLDLSLGTFSDAGAEALLDSPQVKQLEKLDISHHYCSPSMVERLKQLPIEVEADDAQTADEYDGELSRYVAHGE